MRHTSFPLHGLLLAIALFLAAAPLSHAQVLDKQRQLDRQTFWDNRDWNWYHEQIPFFECPDDDLTTTWYYRWELLTKHLTYGSPNSGYSFTEFIDRPFWSGAYGAISCPAGHQLYEARWLRQPRIARDYARYWFRTPGAQPRNYSTWLADGMWATQEVHPDDAFTTDLLNDLILNYEGWEQRQFVPEVGLFWQNGHDDGMEFNINSRQTKDILRGAPGFRPSFNAYMWADAQAIARIADLRGDRESREIAKRFRSKADRLKERLQALLWDPERQFFFPMYRDDEERDGHKVKARTLTYQSGQFAGDAHGRELIGYVPWQFNMLDTDKGFEKAWGKLMDREAFFADFGPTTVERHDPMFLLQKSCCWWSGQSWPYATSQTLKGMANLLHNQQQSVVSAADYVRMLQIYSRSHRKGGRPYLAEACHPDTGSFEGHDGYNHSEHYFHSGFCDLVVTGLIGLTPVDGTHFVVAPLAPAEWDWFALDDVPYQNRRISIVWDRLGTRYGKGQGLSVIADGEVVATSRELARLAVTLPPAKPAQRPATNEVAVNFAVNNDGTYYPRISASHTAPNTSISKANDGNFWYHPHPPNRWTCEGSPRDTDTVLLEFGVPRAIHTVKLFFLDDSSEPGGTIRAPRRVELEAWVEERWMPIELEGSQLEQPAGHRANAVHFPTLSTSKLRATLHHQSPARSGLTEFEAWGDAPLPVEVAAPPAGNLAYNPKPEGYPKASASFTDRFGGKPHSAIDGKTVFLPTPMNRWTSYDSKTPTDWLEIDFGKQVAFSRIELAIYDDRGGVQPPTSYVVETWVGNAWKPVEDARRTPAEPAGGVWNEIRLTPIQAVKLRIVFTHKGQARSGVTEVMVWND